MSTLQFSVRLNFQFCTTMGQIEDVRNVVNELQTQGFEPLQKTNDHFSVTSDLDTLFSTHLTDLQAAGVDFGGKLRMLLFAMQTKILDSVDVSCIFEWGEYEGEQVNLDLIGSIYIQPDEQGFHQRVLAEKFLAITPNLYRLARPAYGAIYDPDTEHLPINDDLIRSCKIPMLTWINLFGQAYTAKYGRNVLLSIPGYSTTELDSDGVFYQSRPSIVIEDAKAYKRWRRDAVSYLHTHQIANGKKI